MRPLQLTAVLLLALAAPARAAFTDLGAGARAPGMGDAFTAVADDLYAIHYNPAGLAQLERPQVSASYSRLHMGLSDGSSLGLSQLYYAHPLKARRWGTVGGAFERFSLSGLYNESAIYLSWGRQVWLRESGSRLLAGLSFKRLSRSFSQQPEAFNAKNGLATTTSPDPVLAGETGASAMDADMGFIYRFPRRLQLGLMIQHLMEPDVGFAGSDKVGRNVRFGVGYKSMWMNLTGEIRRDSSPTGSSDMDMIVAAERYFPTLERGQLGLRGSLGFGSRDWKQMTMGLSYRINKIQTDYAFVMPIGTVKGTAGTHRVSLTFHFGAPTPEEEITQDMLAQAKRLRDGRDPRYGYEFVDPLRPRDLSDPDLSEVRLYVASGQYRKAHRRLVELSESLPPDEALVRLSNRLALTAYYYPEISEQREDWSVALSSAIGNFLYARDHDALLFASYALSLRPRNTQLENFVHDMEKGVGLKADILPPDHPRSFIRELLFRIEAAYNRGDQEKVLVLLQDLLKLQPKNVTALERVGTSYYTLGRYQAAADVWARALPLEQDPDERRTLQSYMADARRKLGMAPQRPPARPALKPAARIPERKTIQRHDPRDIERLYQKGVEHYARGEQLQATAMFMRILQIDPENEQARKALERLRRRR